MIALALAGSYMVAEFVGGWLTHSLALLADAGHMLSDVASLGLSAFAMWIAGRPAPTHRTFGYYRAEILAALFNGASLIAITIWILFEGIRRLADPPEVLGMPMMGIAVGGLIMNLVCLALLHSDKDHSLNVRGAWLHVLSDTLGSVAAILAGLAVWAWGWNLADPIASLVIGSLILGSAWRLLGETISVLMESAPARIDVEQVAAALEQLPSVREVHELHIWTITSGFESLSAHVVVDDLDTQHETLLQCQELLKSRFSIEHTTIQVEPPKFQDCPCPPQAAHQE